MNNIVVEGLRYDTEKLIDLELDEEEISTGVTRQNVWMTPKSKRVIVETYSIWENPRTHGVQGTNYHFADAEEIASLTHKTGNEHLMALLPEGD